LHIVNIKKYAKEENIPEYPGEVCRIKQMTAPGSEPVAPDCTVGPTNANRNPQ